MQKLFHPKDKEDELRILLTDDGDYTKTKKYLAPLIQQALYKFEFSPETSLNLTKKLLQDIEIAAQRFLEDRKNWDGVPYKFSTYFTWYIAQRINPLNPKIKRASRLAEGTGEPTDKN